MSSTYEIVFDGGSKGNPGKGYGSYQITHNGGIIAHTPEDYGDNITNNQAEYMTLVCALTWLADTLDDKASKSAVSVHGDSQLVIRQLKGEWKIKDVKLRGLAIDARRQMDRFGSVSLNWHPRSKSVERLGH